MRGLYDFVSDRYEKRQRIWPRAAIEARWLADLIPVCCADLRRAWSPELTISDASLSGYTVGSRSMSDTQVALLGRQLERLRFRAAGRRHRSLDRPRSALGILWRTWTPSRL